MGAFEKLLLVGIIVFVAGYMGYLGPSVKESTHNIVDKLLSGSSSSGTTIQIITPDPTEPIKIDAQYTGDVILPIDVRMKIQPGDVVVISFEKLLNSQFGLTNWQVRGVSDFKLWISKDTLEKAKEMGITIDYVVSGNTRVGFKIVAPPEYPEKFGNKTPYFDFVGALGFHVVGANLKNLITGDRSEHKLAFIVRAVNEDKVVKIPVIVVEGGVQGIYSSDSDDAKKWVESHHLILFKEANVKW